MEKIEIDYSAHGYEHTEEYKIKEKINEIVKWINDFENRKRVNMPYEFTLTNNESLKGEKND